MTTATLDRQAIYNRVRGHLLKQGSKSESSSREVCAYRGDDGKRCAIGCLILDDCYKESLEGHAIGIPEVDFALAKSLNISLEALEGDEKFFSGLQRIHDLTHPSVWAGELYVFAKINGLDP